MEREGYCEVFEGQSKRSRRRLRVELESNGSPRTGGEGGDLELDICFFLFFFFFSFFLIFIYIGIIEIIARLLLVVATANLRRFSTDLRVASNWDCV